MRLLVSIAAVAIAALGAQHFYRYMNRRGKSRVLQRRLDVWEGEGGAVPVSQERTASQVSPRRASPATDR
jgi:hypothetical protein